MVITATELKKNMGKYLELSQREDVLITKNGKVYAKLSSPRADKRKILDRLTGSLPKDMDVDKILEERLDNL